MQEHLYEPTIPPSNLPNPDPASPNPPFPKPNGKAIEDPAEIISAPTPEFVVNPYFPAKYLHVIGGSSGSGKTPLLFQMAGAVRSGEEILGISTSKLNPRVISLDMHPESSHYSGWAERVGLPSSSVVKLGAREPTLDDLLRAGEGADVLFVENLLRLVPNGNLNNYREVANFIDDVLAACRARCITIVGTWPSAKEGSSSKPSNPRERLYGAVSASAMVYTVALLEKVVPDNDEDPRRRLRIIPKNEVPTLLQLKFNEDGMLEVCDDQGAAESKLEYQLLSFKHGTPLSRKFIEEQILQGTPKSTVTRLISKAVSKNMLSKAGRGLYRVNRTSA